ncbi:MAG: D-alanine--D-alanine ligase [Chitinispirillaceae bacterium]
MSIQVNVIMGGPSAEYEVSLKSGREVLINLDKNQYRPRAVVVTQSKEFYYKDIDVDIPSEDILKSPDASFKGPFAPFQAEEVWNGCDVAFLALHGEFGEDGVIQGFLDTLGIPYIGSDVYASAVAMNKITSKFLFSQSGLTVPPFSVYGTNYSQTSIDSIVEKHGFPCFVKCPQSGSSRLMGKAKDRQSLTSLLKKLQQSAPDILVETTITGTEFSCGVIEEPDGSLRSLPPVEIRPVGSDFFDYDAKYSEGATLEIVPAPHPQELLSRVEEVAKAAHRVIGCSGVSRTDMIYSDCKLYVLEINTLPGLTTTSLLPKAFKADGGTYAGLLDLLISSAMGKGNKQVNELCSGN